MTDIDIYISGTSWHFDESSGISRLSIFNQLSPNISRAIFSIRDNNYNLSAIRPGYDVNIFIDGYGLFSGYIDSISPQYIGTKTYTFLCVSRTVDLYKIYTDKDAVYSGNTNEIASQIISDYIPQYSFNFIPSSSSNDTGVYITSFFTKGLSVGKCFENLTNLDGYFYTISGLTSNIVSGNVYYFDISGNIGIITDENINPSTFQINESGLGRKITAVRIYGGYGIAEEKKNISRDTYFNINNFSVAQIFNRGECDALYDLRILYSASYSQNIMVSILPVLYNIAPDISEIIVSGGTLSNAAYMKDEDSGTYATFSINGDSGTIYLYWLDASNNYYLSKNIKAIRVWGENLETFANLKVYYIMDGDEVYISESGYVYGGGYIIKSTQGFVASGLKLEFSLQTANKSVRIREVEAYSPGYSDARMKYLDFSYINDRYSKSVTLNASLAYVFSQPITLDCDLSDYQYWAIYISKLSGNDTLYIGATTATTFGYKTLYPVQMGVVGMSKNLCLKFNLKGNIYYVSSLTSPYLGDIFPYEIYSENITHIDQAKALAERLIHGKQMNKRYIIKLKHPSPSFNVGHFVTISSNVLDVYDTLPITSVRHELIGNNLVNTTLVLGYEDWSIEKELGKIVSDLKNKQIT